MGIQGTLIDLTWQKFGRLTVVKRSYPNNKYGRAMWLCKCDCGKEKIILGSLLRDGRTKSCGCLRKEIMSKTKKIKYGLASLHTVAGKYKINARKRGLKYKLTETQFKKLTKQNCYYCGAKPNNVSNIPGYNGKYVYGGLDRVDNKKGYTIDNVVPCCKHCNMAKNNMTLQEFKNWIRRVYNNIHKNSN